jgi:APA family basic amino acid/polyamine antiporter
MSQAAHSHLPARRTRNVEFTAPGGASKLFELTGLACIRPKIHSRFIPANTATLGEIGWSGIMRAAGVIFFAYIGFDAVSTAAQEARHPQKDMPIGIIGSLAICTVLYVLFSLVRTGVVNYTELGGAAPVALAIDRTPYDWLKPLVKLAVICGFTSVILVMLLGQSRVFFSMSRDGLLPRVFSDVHPKWKTPGARTCCSCSSSACSRPSRTSRW